MKVIFLCGREEGYTRNEVLLRALGTFSSVTRITDPEPRRSILYRSIILSLRAIPKLLFERYDLVFVGFYGHLLLLPIYFFSRRPILFDAFISTFDTLVSDRKSAVAGSLTAKLAYALDWITCRMARHVLIDTLDQIDYFSKTFHLPSKHFSALPVGCNETIFHPLPAQTPGKLLTILYYCTYLPLHGADIVVQAARQLSELPICFRLIGDGPDYQRVRNLVETSGVRNVELHPPVSLVDLSKEIAQADICLGGHFGTSDKAGRVIPGKIYQILAMGRPCIATDYPANRTLLTHLKTAYLCTAGNPQSLATAISTLAQNPELRDQIARNGRKLYESTSSEAIIAGQLKQIVNELL